MTTPDAYRDPLSYLTETSLQAKLQQAESQSGSNENPEETELTIQATNFRQLAAELAQADATEATEAISQEAIEAAKSQIVSELTTLLDTYGRDLLETIKGDEDFWENPTLDLEARKCPTTYANFSTLIDQRKALIHQKISIRRQMKAQNGVAGTAGLTQRLVNAETAQSGETVEHWLRKLWQDQAIQVAHLRVNHLGYIHDLRNHRAIHESDSIIRFYNEIHGKLYGSDAYKVAGIALTGPPGEGKTSVLEEYFRIHGVEPLSPTLDPGQSAFTLMARPKIDLGDQATALKALRDMLSGDEEDNQEALQIIDAKALEAAQKLSKEGDAEKGFFYGVLLHGAMNNQPVILNEFAEVADWSFAYGLLTAVPATDDEAGPMPGTTPSDLTKKPIGWYYDTITAQWIRVREKFRVCFTGNIGAEYGTATAPPALISRIGSSSIPFTGIPASELANAIALPHLCHPDTGYCLVDDRTAYRMHFLVNDALPKIKSALQSRYQGKNKFWPISPRVIIDMCKLMNPMVSDPAVSLDEAIMQAYVRPSHALRYTDSLKIILPLLRSVGFLEEHTSELMEMLPESGMDQLEQVVKDTQADHPDLKIFAAEQYIEDDESYEGACPVCGIKHCPYHGKKAQEYVGELDHLASLGGIGVDRELVQEISQWQRKLVEQKQWGMLLESHFGNKDDSLSMDILGEEGITEIGKYATNLAEEATTDPAKVSSYFAQIQRAVELKFLPSSTLTEEIYESLFGYWRDKWKAEFANGPEAYLDAFWEFAEPCFALIGASSDHWEKIGPRFREKEAAQHYFAHRKTSVMFMQSPGLYEKLTKTKSKRSDTPQSPNLKAKNTNPWQKDFEKLEEQILEGNPPDRNILQRKGIKVLQYLEALEDLRHLGLLSDGAYHSKLSAIIPLVSLDRASLESAEKRSLGVYARYIRFISRLKQVSIQHTLEHFMAPSKSEPLPPLPIYGVI